MQKEVLPARGKKLGDCQRGEPDGLLRRASLDVASAILAGVENQHRRVRCPPNKYDALL
jgi:hypothetical protein